MTTQNERYYTVSEMAKIIGHSRDAVKSYVHKKKFIPVGKRAGTKLYSRETLDKIATYYLELYPIKEVRSNKTDDVSEISSGYIEDDLKEQAEMIYSEISLDLQTAVNIFLKQTIIDNGFPFRPKL